MTSDSGPGIYTTGLTAGLFMAATAGLVAYGHARVEQTPPATAYQAQADTSLPAQSSGLAQVRGATPTRGITALLAPPVPSQGAQQGNTREAALNSVVAASLKAQSGATAALPETSAAQGTNDSLGYGVVTGPQSLQTVSAASPQTAPVARPAVPAPAAAPAQVPAAALSHVAALVHTPAPLPASVAKASIPAALEHDGHDTHAAHEPHEPHDNQTAAVMGSAVPQRSSVFCVGHLQTVAARTRIYFDSTSAKLDKRSREAAYYLASLVAKCPEAKVTISGFTDPRGDPDTNLALSWKRANNVLAAIREAGFPTKRYTAQSHMQDHPDGICPHYDVVDRRAEFVVSEFN